MPSLRPSEFTLQRLDPASLPALELGEAPEGGVDVFWVAPPSYAEYIRADRPLRERILNIKEEMLSIWPVNVRPDKEDFLQPRYGTLSRICVTPLRYVGWYERPESPEDVVGLLELLPDGFEKRFEFGLGLSYENRFICEAIRQVPGVTTLVVHGGGGRNDRKVEGPLYVLGETQFNSLRKQLSSTTTKHQSHSRREKYDLAYNSLLHAVDPLRFPQKRKRLQQDQLSELAPSQGSPVALSKRDGRTAARLVRQNAEAIFKDDPASLLELKADIERVTLAELTKRFEDMLKKQKSEQAWQAFFQANPFILSMAVGGSALLIQGTPYYGGTRFDGTGARRGDFLMVARSTRNATIIEIKRPDTSLLERVEYRDDVYGPSKHLGGALSQVLDQRQKLQANIQALNDERSDLDKVRAYSVRCIVLAGTTPPSTAERKSFEHLRNALKDVVLLTFDELLDRLREIQEALAGESDRTVQGPGQDLF